MIGLCRFCSGGMHPDDPEGVRPDSPGRSPGESGKPRRSKAQRAVTAASEEGRGPSGLSEMFSHIAFPGLSGLALSGPLARALLVCPALLLLFLTTASPRACAQVETATADAPSPPPLRFRRVYVPEDRLEDLPRERNRLVPMPAEEFDRLVSAARSAADSEVLAGGIVSARYQARLEGNRLVDGQAVLDIFHSSKSDSLLPLDPCGLGVSAADWLSPEARPAVVGLAGDGRLTVLVPGGLASAKLQLAWSLAGATDERGAIEFTLTLPVCGATELVLDVPEGMTPTIEHAVVARQTSDTPGMARWHIELRGGLPARLRIVPEPRLQSDVRWTRLRQSTVYGFSLRGLEISAELQLDARGEPLAQAVVQLGRNVQLVTAQYGDATIAWTIAPSATPGDATRAVFDLPEPIRGAGRVLRLTAWAPLVLDRVWKLPTVRVESVSWQEGTASLLVPGPLVLTQLDVRDGRQSKTGVLSGPQSGQRIDVQQFAENATIEVVLSRPTTAVDARLGVAVVLGSQQVQALETAALSLDEGERFEIEANVARRWIIDAVETAPADMLDDWTIGREPTGRVLRIRLAKPLSPTAPVRLLLRTRRLGAPSARGFTSADLSPLEFHDAPDLRQWIWVRAAETFQLQFSGDDASSRADPDALGADVLALFAEPPQAPLFACSQEDAGWRVLLEPQKPDYSAQIHLQATIADGMLRETYRFACMPAESRVDQLIVRFSHARDKPLDCTLVADGETPLGARRQTVADSENGEALDGETWQIDLEPPQSGPFEVRATRVTALGVSSPVSLAALPEASNQQAVVVVESSDSAAVRVEGRRLKPVSTESLPDDRVNLARASFRYDPAVVFRDAASLRRTVLNVASQPSESAPSPAWAWNCRLHSWLQPDGTGRHLAVYRLETTGRRELRLGLPTGTNVDSVRGVWVDGARTPWRPWRHDSGGVAVTLPEGRRYPVVAIQFETTGQALQWTESVAATWPMADVPLLARRWTVWLPPDYQGCVPSPAWLLESPAQLSWVERLFGPLARPTELPRFDPTQIGGLRGLAAGPGDVAAADAATGSGRSRDEDAGPWADTAVAELAPADTTGWSVYDLEVPPGETARLAIVRRDVVQAVGLAVLFGVMALGCWLTSDRPAVLIFLAVAFGVVALVVPETYAGLASGAVIGTLLCWGFRFVRRREPTGLGRRWWSESGGCKSCALVCGHHPCGYALDASPVRLRTGAADGAGRGRNLAAGVQRVHPRRRRWKAHRRDGPGFRTSLQRTAPPRSHRDGWTAGLALARRRVPRHAQLAAWRRTARARSAHGSLRRPRVRLARHRGDSAGWRRHSPDNSGRFARRHAGPTALVRARRTDVGRPR